MAFNIGEFEYLPFWWAAWNAVIFWEAINKSNRGSFKKVTQNHWTYKFIRAMPCTGRWAEITSILRLYHVRRGAYTPFTFRRLVDFLILAEDRVDSLGHTPLERSDAAMQLINTVLIVPATTQQLPVTIVERNQIENRQMRLLFAENPQARRYKRVATLWVHWIDSFGAQYPRGWRATMLRMRELVDGAPDVEHSPPFVLWNLLAPVESVGSNEPEVEDPPEEGSSGGN